MAALMRGLLSTFSQLQISTKSLRRNEIAYFVSGVKCAWQNPTLETCSVRTLRSAASSSFESAKFNAKQDPLPRQEVVENPHDTELAVTKDIVAKVNNQIESNSHGRLFAIIHMAGKQRRVTDGDLIMIEGTHPANVGDVIRAEKILLLGSKDFTLLGRPLLRPDLKKAKEELHEDKLMHFTILRINCVRLEGLIDQRPEIEGVDGRVF